MEESTILGITRILFSLRQPAIFPVFLVAIMVLSHRIGAPSIRALSAAMVFGAMIHTIAWAGYGSSAAVHAVCAVIWLAVIVPIAIRSKRRYPVMVAAAGLLSTVAMILEATPLSKQGHGGDVLALVANAILVTSLSIGIGLDWRWQRKQAVRRSNRSPASSI